MSCTNKIEWLSFPLFVKWYITGKCNLRCKHCYLTDYTKQPKKELVFQMIDYFKSKGVQGILFIGGEPFLRRDFVSILEKTVNSEISASVATNGILLNKELTDKLSQLGVKNIQVSIEGSSADINDTVRGNGSFDKAIQGIKYLKSSGANVTLGYTLSKNNMFDIDKIVSLANELSVDTMRFEAFVPVGTGSSEFSDGRLDVNSVQYIKKKISDLSKSSNVKIINPFDCSYSCSKDKSTFGCGAGTTNLVVNSDMTISACDLYNEKDRSSVKITSPSILDDLWVNHSLFKKWRGLEMNTSLGDFSNVHNESCHVSYLEYGKNLFKDGEHHERH